MTTLEKIREEIEKMPTDYCGGYIGLDKKEVLQIIDKYDDEECEHCRYREKLVEITLNEDAVSRQAVIDTILGCECMHIFELSEIIPKIKQLPRKWLIRKKQKRKKTTIEKIRTEIEQSIPWNTEEKAMKSAVLDVIDRYAEQEPCEDAVCREDAIETLSIMFSGQDDILNHALECIEQLPNVQPKAKTGHWKKWEYSTRRCSECDCIVTHEYKFCPDCGAKMVELKEGVNE